MFTAQERLGKQTEPKEKSAGKGICLWLFAVKHEACRDQEIRRVLMFCLRGLLAVELVRRLWGLPCFSSIWSLSPGGGGAFGHLDVEVQNKERFVEQVLGNWASTRNSDGMLCVQCASGWFSGSGASVCTACSAGKYLTNASGETDAGSCTRVSRCALLVYVKGSGDV